MGEQAGPFEVYIHVPFCLRRCGYCDFNTYTGVDLGGGASRANYAAMAIREMEELKTWQREHALVEPPASSVFFGGGTPTLLPAQDLVAMLDAVRRLWGIEQGAEITTEANPDTVDQAYVDQLAHGGFNRISLGMQSAVPQVLRVLDRTHSPANVSAAVQAADRAGLRSSVDLIYGAPGESLEDWRTSLETAINLGVNHISAYALTVEPTTKMGRQIAAGTLPKPDDDDEADKYDLADELLTAAGLGWYEISNWARPGYESRHNLGYWRNIDWAGIGPGAHSHYRGVNLGPVAHTLGAAGANSQTEGFRKAESPDQLLGVTQVGQISAGGNKLIGTAGQTQEIRAWNLTHPKAWWQAISAGCIPWQGLETISASEHLEETVMLGLRLREGLDLATLERASGHPVDPDLVGSLHLEGLITLEANHLVPTRKGRLLNDTLIERILQP
ncbi:coproporphyrinogen III oxidase [Bifidobacterium aemilianum]|uniref:Heme chaperone HemW n=1 Tax=Bifidobacterium aemilianum TaxID=2493120 RepID=A0A366KCC4_9BIFI|nr:radical SAM family heme chaperone HemW [Bifidobacterium aemilianum]RBP98311.1 coproporphyrinogen III oxidase [Bifidobacterium aemilianum]